MKAFVNRHVKSSGPSARICAYACTPSSSVSYTALASMQGPSKRGMVHVFTVVVVKLATTSDSKGANLFPQPLLSNERWGKETPCQAPNSMGTNPPSQRKALARLRSSESSKSTRYLPVVCLALSCSPLQRVRSHHCCYACLFPHLLLPAYAPPNGGGHARAPSHPPLFLLCG